MRSCQSSWVCSFCTSKTKAGDPHQHRCVGWLLGEMSDCDSVLWQWFYTLQIMRVAGEMSRTVILYTSDHEGSWWDVWQWFYTMTVILYTSDHEGSWWDVWQWFYTMTVILYTSDHEGSWWDVWQSDSVLWQWFYTLQIMRVAGEISDSDSILWQWFCTHQIMRVAGEMSDKMILCCDSDSIHFRSWG